ncbi:hypothetical protein [Clostridium sp.]|uniref:hypothetical protein n=1 Tax=Clostridium sp. TaxID=1506 RepID=UPI002841AA6E|nr:hypothetical protein [Clostridium sp.]MDR3593577.1 hypothetical protein [Clostridium sp.]
MSEKKPLNEIGESLQEMSDSLKEIVGIIKPKPKKANLVVTIGWVFVGGMALYVLYVLYKIIERM